MKQLTGVALVVVSSMAYGAMPIFARLAYASGASPVTVLFLRFTLAAAMMLLLMAASRRPFPRGKILAGLAGLGVFFYVGQSLAYFYAISLASASLVALLLYLSPILVMLVAVVFLHEPLTRAKVLALALALAGAVITVGPAGEGELPGIALGVLSATIGAGYVLASSRVLQRVQALPATTIIIGSAALVYIIMAAVQGYQFPATTGGWLATLAMAAISTVVAIGAFLAGMERIGPTNAATLGTLEPVWAVLLSALILNEAITPGRIIGGLLILTAVVLITRAVGSNAA